MDLRAIATFGVVLAVSACGGGSSGGGGGEPNVEPPPPKQTVLFEDEFDAGFPGTQWLMPVGDAGVEASVGTPPPSLGLRSGEATTNVGPFARNGKLLRFFVQLAWPPGCPTQGPTGTDVYASIQIHDFTTNRMVARLWLWLKTGCLHLEETYEIEPLGERSVNDVSINRTWDPGNFDNGFHDYGFVIEEDGTAFWTKDGVVVAEASVPFVPEKLVLRLSAAIADLQPACYDAVLVDRWE